MNVNGELLAGAFVPFHRPSGKFHGKTDLLASDGSNLTAGIEDGSAHSSDPFVAAALAMLAELAKSTEVSTEKE